METVKKRRRSDGKENAYRRQRTVQWAVTLVILALAYVVVFVLWLLPMRVAGDSMAPALRENEIVLVDRIAKYWKTPARGDMVLFETADGAFIKRIVGLPGETVDIVDGRVYIDSRPLDESAYAVNFVGSAAAVTVPSGSVYVLGDNREKIYDSRLSTVGCIPYAEMTGVLRFRVSPLSRVTVFF